VRHAFLVREKLYLRPLEAADVSDEDLEWLHDAEVTRYVETGRFPTRSRRGARRSSRPSSVSTCARSWPASSPRTARAWACCGGSASRSRARCARSLFADGAFRDCVRLGMFRHQFYKWVKEAR
jgi:hypothetical protein